MRYDVFISYASEDKAQIALPLAHYLRDRGLKIWLDEFELTIGDSLRRTIDHGLAMSRFGVVILSPNFFKKGWTNRELDGLVAREETEKFILPIWHNVTGEDVTRYSPTLAGKLAVSTDKGIEYVAEQIIRAIQKEDPLKASHVQMTSIVDLRASDLAKIRRRVLEAHSSWELRELLFETDEFLSRYPNNPEARLLKERILRAIDFEEAPSLPKVGRPAYRMARPPIFMYILILLGILLLIWLIKWFLGG